jgi:hypothetical protein
MTFYYLKYTVYIAYAAGSIDEVAMFIDQDECLAFCARTGCAPGYVRSQVIDDSEWVNLANATQRGPAPRVYVSRRCTLRPPLSR